MVISHPSQTAMKAGAGGQREGEWPETEHKETRMPPSRVCSDVKFFSKQLVN